MSSGEEQATRPRPEDVEQKRKFLGVIALLSLLGCEIERVAPAADSPSAETSRAADRTSPAPTTLSEVFSPDERAASKTGDGEPRTASDREKAAAKAPPAPQIQPLETGLGPPVPELESWLEEQRRTSSAPGALTDGTLFIYGGGAEVGELSLPSTLPADALEAVSAFVAAFEASPATNAGVGAALRLDGSVELESMVRNEQGRMGLVLGVHGFAHPVRLASALVRAGGAELRDQAVARLGTKLGGTPLPPPSAEAREQYFLDLSARLKTGETEPGLALFQLLVAPEVTAKALSSVSEQSSVPLRDPVFAVFVTSSGVSLAASYGGVPLSLPGAPSVLQDGKVFWSEGSRFAFVSETEGCPKTARDLLTSSTTMAQLARLLERECPTRRYALVDADQTTTNLSASTYRGRIRDAQGVGPSGHAEPPRSPASSPAPNPAPKGADSRMTSPPAPVASEVRLKPEVAPVPSSSGGEAKQKQPATNTGSVLPP